jgi:hypothetical protein
VHSIATSQVFIAAIAGHVPDRMVQAIRAFQDFCYIARRDSHTTSSIKQLEEALARFQDLRTIFEEVGVRPNGFHLPRQHSLVHYAQGIKLFGSPNGLCSSITESRHITAVKKPWRRSNRFNALGQMLQTNTRLSKLAAARAEFSRRGMLAGDVLTMAQAAAGCGADQTTDRMHLSSSHGGHSHQEDEETVSDEEEGASSYGYHESAATSFFELARRPGKYRFMGLFQTISNLLAAETCRVHTMAIKLNQPNLQELCRQFLWDQVNPDLPFPPETDDISLDDYPVFIGNVSRYHSGHVTFFAPTEDCGLYGMHRETIRSCPQWRNGYSRYDTVLIQNTGDDSDVMRGMVVGRVLSFLSFTYLERQYDTALVQWLIPVSDAPDAVTGMWVVKPEIKHGKRSVGLVHTDSIVRGCHLIGVYGKHRLPKDFPFTLTHDAFNLFYVNHFIDYHAHATIP